LRWTGDENAATSHFQQPISSFKQMFKRPVEQGRSERDAEAYGCWYVEALSDARTKLEGRFNIR
jgi:hypothetical protein